MSADHTQLQLLQRNLEMISSQKLQFEQQLSELDSARKELPSAQSSYKIVGKLMIQKSSEELEKELKEEQEVLKLRVSTLEKQEAQLKERLEAQQEQLLKELTAKQGGKTE